jgi:hypothetical protein
MHANPYAEDLGGREPLSALSETPQQIRAIVDGWSGEMFERSYAPGKWSARKLLAHLAQTEIALSTRARFALATPDYRAQSFDQDDWMPLDEHVDAKTALDAYTSLRRMNMVMWRRLTDAQKDRLFFHPDFGEVSVIWIAAQMAGHDIHHLKQFQQIAGAAGS